MNVEKKCHSVVKDGVYYNKDIYVVRRVNKNCSNTTKTVVYDTSEFLSKHKLVIHIFNGDDIKLTHIEKTSIYKNCTVKTYNINGMFHIETDKIGDILNGGK